LGQRSTRKLTERQVADFIASYDGDPKDFRKGLAAACGVSEVTVKRRLPELVASGHLTTRRNGKTIVYEVAETRLIFGKWRPARKDLGFHRGEDQALSILNQVAATGTYDDVVHAWGTLAMAGYPMPRTEMGELRVHEMFPLLAEDVLGRDAERARQLRAQRKTEPEAEFVSPEEHEAFKAKLHHAWAERQRRERDEAVRRRERQAAVEAAWEAQERERWERERPGWLAEIRASLRAKEDPGAESPRTPLRFRMANDLA
jgi:hypothetical protein